MEGAAYGYYRGSTVYGYGGKRGLITGGQKGGRCTRGSGHTCHEPCAGVAGAQYRAEPCLFGQRQRGGHSVD